MAVSLFFAGRKKLLGCSLVFPRHCVERPRWRPRLFGGLLELSVCLAQVVNWERAVKVS